MRAFSRHLLAPLPLTLVVGAPLLLRLACRAAQTRLADARLGCHLAETIFIILGILVPLLNVTDVVKIGRLLDVQFVSSHAISRKFASISLWGVADLASRIEIDFRLLVLGLWLGCPRCAAQIHPRGSQPCAVGA